MNRILSVIVPLSTVAALAGMLWILGRAIIAIAGFDRV